MTTTSATPTLPASWQPTVAGCLASGGRDFWQWDYGTFGDSRVVLGGPSQTTNCLPTAWASDVVYSGSECPLYYTTACQGKDSLSAVTCCPSIHEFKCATSISAEYHGSQFRCASAWATSGPIPVKHTNFVVNTLELETQTAQTYLDLWALAIIYVTSTSEPSATSTNGSNDLTAISSGTENPSQPSTPTTQSTSETSSSNTGISTGASAGIGVGAAAGVVLLAAVAWWLYHRRRSQKQVSKLSTDHSPYTAETAVQKVSHNGQENPEAVPATRSELSNSPPAPRELSA